MGPKSVASSLLAIADYLDGTGRPSRSRVIAALLAAVVATDRSLAESVGRALAEQVAKLMPEEFSGETFDTSDRGKGYKDGYVSWAMDPNTWEEAGILGGILFMCEYDTSKYSSESLGEGEDWEGRQEGALDVTVQAAYYNKSLGGGVDEKTDLGSCTLLLDSKENVVEAEISDRAAFEAGITSIIQKILTSPPDEAVSESRRRRALPPTTSPRTLLKWLLRQGRTDVKRSELNDLARSMSKRTGRPYGQVLREVDEFFKSRTWPVDEEARRAASARQPVLSGSTIAS